MTKKPTAELIAHHRNIADELCYKAEMAYGGDDINLCASLKDECEWHKQTADRLAELEAENDRLRSAVRPLIAGLALIKHGKKDDVEWLCKIADSTLKTYRKKHAVPVKQALQPKEADNG